MTQNTSVEKAKTEVQKKVQTSSERFSAMVIREYAATAGSVALTSFQKRLMQNYFISIDMALKTAEERRLKKSETYRDKLPVTWQNINMESLAIHVVACARIGFDPALPNHINMMPFKNNALQKYDIVFIEGYRGKEIKAMKYGFNPPDDIIVELVFENDTFKPIKKDKDNKVENYIFKVAENAFNRGEIIGGFYYHSWSEKPEKNKLVFFTRDEIEKRKPDYASPEFWGGEKTKYVDDPNNPDKKKKAGTEKVEGWYQEMAWKTIYRAAYSAITIDSQKIDDDYIRLTENERVSGDPGSLGLTPNSESLSFDEAEVVEDDKQKPVEVKSIEETKQPEKQPDKKATEQTEMGF